MTPPQPDRRMRGRSRTWMHSMGEILSEISGESHGQRRYWAILLELEPDGIASACMNLRDDSMPGLRLEIRIEGGARGRTSVVAKELRPDAHGHLIRAPLGSAGRPPADMAKAEAEARRAVRRRAFLDLRRRLEPSLWGWDRPDRTLRRHVGKRWPKRPLPEGGLMPRCSLSWAWEPGRRIRVPGRLDMGQVSQTLTRWWIQMMIGTNRDNNHLPRSAKARDMLWVCPWDTATMGLRRIPWDGEVECEHGLSLAGIDSEGEPTALPPPHPGRTNLRFGLALENCAMEISRLSRHGSPLSGIRSWLHDRSQADAEQWRPPPWRADEDDEDVEDDPARLLEAIAAREMAPEMQLSLRVPRSFLYRVWSPRRTRGGAPLPPGGRAALARPRAAGGRGASA